MSLSHQQTILLLPLNYYPQPIRSQQWFGASSPAVSLNGSIANAPGEVFGQVTEQEVLLKQYNITPLHAQCCRYYYRVSPLLFPQQDGLLRRIRYNANNNQQHPNSCCRYRSNNLRYNHCHTFCQYPASGTGTWSIVSGSAVITNSASATTSITGLTAGSSYTFRWTISIGVCPPSTDDITVNVVVPTTANAGPNQYL